MSSTSADETVAKPVRRISRRVRLLLLLPFAAVLAVPICDRINPGFFSVPFVYWYQCLWAGISAVLLYLVYRLEN